MSSSPIKMQLWTSTSIRSVWKRADAPVSEDYRWLTVAPVGGDAEVALEPPGISNRKPGDTGIALDVDDFDKTFSELAGRGVTFVDEAGALARDASIAAASIVMTVHAGGWSDPIPRPPHSGSRASPGR